MSIGQKIGLAAALLFIVSAVVYFERLRPQRTLPGSAEIPLPAEEEQKIGAKSEERIVVKKNYPRAVELVNPSGFLNAQPFALKDIVGKKVVLVDFWTYSCINCQRTTPYLNAWYEKYRGQGFEIVGVHTPEFEFEKKRENVAAAIERFGIKYPVVQDNEYATWNAYGNRYWPRKYLIDIDGYIVYDHIGEGGYEETERKIQGLLKERAGKLAIANGVPSGTVAPQEALRVEIEKVGTPEVYFGASRNSLLGNGRRGASGLQTFEVPQTIERNVLYLGGSWHIENEYAQSAAPGAKVAFRYRAKNVYMVARSDTPVSVKILRDGKPLGAEAGADVKHSGDVTTFTVAEDRLYKLIEDSSYGEHTLELIVELPGAQLFTFTFG
jgi:thiol-disulfide isomerase/thioredoxin